MEEIIDKIESELDFQQKQANEYGYGIFKDDILFARYDQAAKILKWVLKILKGEDD